MTKISQPEIHYLSNGMQVLLQNYDGPVAANYWWVKTGSGDERPAEAGFAHFLEHMHFKDAAAKDSGKPSTGQLANAVESLGGDINAYTSFDQTVYHVTCAAEHWEKVLDHFGTMAKPQRFLKSDFVREREVILEELKKNEDSPGRQLFQGLFSATYAKHPYGKPVIGYVKTLKAATVQSLEAFYRRQYVSGNMGLILVGPIGSDPKSPRRRALIKILEKRFGKSVIAKKAGFREFRTAEPELRKAGMTWKQTPFDVQSSTLAFSFRVPGLKDPEMAALDTLSGALSMGELSRLYQRLFYGESIVTEVGGGLYVPNDPGMLYFQAEVDEPTKLAKVSKLMFEEMDRVRREGVTSEEFERVVTSTESERLYASQTADGLASRLGFLHYVVGDPDYDRDYLETLKNTEAAQIKEVAQEYLDIRRMSGVLMLPKAQADFDGKEIQAIANEFMKPKPIAVAMGARSKTTQFPEVIERKSGIKVIYHPRMQSHVVSVHAAALGGLRLEGMEHWGASHLMSMTWNKGIANKDARAIAALVEGSAASLDGFSGRNTVGASFTGLSRDWHKLSQLYSEILLEPTFPTVELEHSRRVALEEIKSIEDHTPQLCSKLFLESLYGDHPYARLTIGNEETVKSLDSSVLKTLHQKWLTGHGLVVSVVGAVTQGQLEEFIEDLEVRIKHHKVASLHQSQIADPELKAPRWVEKSLGREQIHIIVGGLGTKINDSERFTLRILQNILGGQSGRLFIELREKKSLAYTVSPISFEGIERGYVGTYIGCSPNKRTEAIDGIKKVLEDFAKKGPSKAEMSRAQEFYLGRRAMDLQSDSSLAMSYSLDAVYGAPLKLESQIAKEVRKVTPKQVQEFCRKYLVESPMVTTVVG